MSSDKRSGSDLLRDVEAKVDNLFRYVQNLDNNIKILLNNFNKLTNAEHNITVPKDKVTNNISKKENIEKKTNNFPELGEVRRKYKFEDLPKTSRFEAMSRKAGVVNDDPVELSDEDKYELAEAGAKTGQQRVHRAPRTEGNIVNVKQQVVYPSGAPVMIATVEIFDDSGKKLKTLRTNSKGKWAAPLMPGKYTIHIVKYVAPDSGKQPFDIEYQANVPAEKEFTIPTPNIGEEE